ncbi:DUF5689 domain-containing protein, partial [Bacteroidota bacterium]
LTTIAEVQGSGSSTPMNGSTVTVSGIVTASFDNSYYIQSGNNSRSGICIYDVRRGSLGDSVVVTGVATEYNNLTELTDLSYFYVFEGEHQVTPVDLTIPEADEDYEGMLVRISNVTFLEGDALIPVNEAMTLTFTDGTNEMTVYSRYNSRLGGKTAPSGTVNVTGIVSQYQDNYQILIHEIDDIEAGEDNEAPLLTGVVVNDASWIELSFSEKIEKASAEQVANYSISGDVVIQGAYLYNETRVLLYVSGLQVQEYTVTVMHVSDLRGNHITETSMTFNSEFTAVKDLSSSEKGMRVYPNPSEGITFVSLPASSEPGTLYLINLNGKIITSIPVTPYETKVRMDIQGIHSGTYLLSFRTSNLSCQEKIQIK